MDATLKELSMLVKETTASARWSGARLAFSSAYRDKYDTVALRLGGRHAVALYFGARG